MIKTDIDKKLDEIIGDIPGDWRIIFEAESNLKTALTLLLLEARMDELERHKKVWLDANLNATYFLSVVDRKTELQTQRAKLMKGENE